MTVKAAHCTPMLHVADVERSIAFYEQLGFTTIDTEGSGPIGWARLHCEGGALMLTRADAPVDPSQQAVLFYMYTPDLPALRDRLTAAGLRVSPITRPHYMRAGEVRLEDPDGYVVLLGHWGEQEHREWLARLEARRVETGRT